MMKFLNWMTSWKVTSKAYTTQPLCENQSVQQLLQECLSKLKTLCGEDRRKGLVLAQASRTAWGQCISEILLSQVPIMLKASQLYYRSTTNDIDGLISWTSSEIYELDNDDGTTTAMIRAQAKINDALTKKHTHDFIIAISLNDALTDDFQLILNKLNMQQTTTTTSDEDDDATDANNGVTLH